jgi:3-hydroxyisobutyrate dehydrogenase-like beta-hydroxyacid dehydrogenase
MNTPPSPVGLIGLGLMGSALAARLVAQGHPVVGFDIRPERRINATSTADVFAQCPLVFLSLPTHHEVNAVLFESAGQLRAGQIIIDTTTGEPANSEALARSLSEKGVSYLDGTISGNSDQARAGDIVWMVGGETTALWRCASLLRQLGRELVHTGPAGSGARMKLVTNLALGLNRAALAESLAFAEALGLDASEALRVLRSSAAHSRVMDAKGEKMLKRDFAPQAMLSQHLKDVRLIRAEAARAGLGLPLTAAHELLLQRAEEMGLGELDNSAVIEALRGRGGER